jgi:SagB-type dehydrogenase family enzyme
MPNSDTSAARSFHDATKLSYISLATKPPLYKSYPGLPTVALPAEMPSPEAPTLPAVGGVMSASQGPLDLAAIAQLLHYSAGLIRRSTLRTAGEVHYRAAASAGALYPIELYMVCGDLPGLDAGVYHYGPATNSLSLLRTGDYRGNLAEASAGHPGVADAPATIVCSCVFWRSAWKYRERGYRYCYWDLGTISANLLTAGAAERVPVGLRFGFVDRSLCGFLGLNGIDEAPAMLASIGAPAGELVPGSGDVPGLITQESNDLVSGAEPYPVSRRLHAASWLQTRSDVGEWNREAGANAGSDRDELEGTGEGFRPLRSGPDGSFQGDIDLTLFESAPLGECIRSRGSTRRFSLEPISWEAFRSVIGTVTTGINAPNFREGLAPYMNLYFIVNAVEGLASGAYHYNPFYKGLRLLKAGNFREMAGHLGFEQALPADAAAVGFITADLKAADAAFGARGYRLVQTLAGIIGGRLYLGMHSVGLGATGLTFYDDSVIEFFSPHAAGQECVFVVPMGAPHATNRVRPFRSRVAVGLDARARGAGQDS